MSNTRINKALEESIRLLDEQIADTQKTMRDLNAQIDQQIKAKQKLMILADAMADDE